MENSKEDYWELRKLIQEFEKLDDELRQKFPTFLESLLSILSGKGNIEDNDIFNDAYGKFNKALNAKREIKYYLGNKTHIIASHDLARQLKDIRDNKGYCVDEFYAIYSMLDKDISQEIEGDFDWMDELFAEGTADYIDDNFYRRRNQMGAIICKRSLPPNLNYHLFKVKECFSLGLFEATIIYCRALIESSTYQALKGRDRKVIHIRREIKLSELLKEIKKYKRNSIIIDHAYEVKKLADDELHETEEIVKINENIASEAVKKTFSYIEYIFNDFEK